MIATATQSPTVPSLPSISITAVRGSLLRSHPTASKASHHYHKNAAKYWDAFYKRHQHKVRTFSCVFVYIALLCVLICWFYFFSLSLLQFFKDRHYLEKDWGSFFEQDNDDVSRNGKVVLEVYTLALKKHIILLFMMILVNLAVTDSNVRQKYYHINTHILRV